MRDAAVRIGREDLAIMALAIYVLQSFIGYPLTSFLLKKEARALKSKFNAGDIKGDDKSAVASTETKKLLPQLPEKYVTTNTILFKLAIAGLIGILITNALNSAFGAENGDFISRYVILLIVGVILNEIGFLDDAPIARSQIGGFTSVVIVGFSVVAGLANATPQVVFGLIGLIILSAIAGRFLGYSREMSISIALSALYGYPGTEILSNEAVKVVAETPAEEKYLLEKIQPNMLIGGFTTVTFGSVIIAGILVNYL